MLYWGAGSSYHIGVYLTILLYSILFCWMHTSADRMELTATAPMAATPRIWQGHWQAQGRLRRGWRTWTEALLHGSYSRTATNYETSTAQMPSHSPGTSTSRSVSTILLLLFPSHQNWSSTMLSRCFFCKDHGRHQSSVLRVLFFVSRVPILWYHCCLTAVMLCLKISCQNAEEMNAVAAIISSIFGDCQ